MFLISTVARLMKIRCRSKPRIYDMGLHNNTDKEPMAAIVSFSLFRQTQTIRRTESFSDILGYIVVELKHITKESTYQSRVHVREPNADWPN